jgi:hypothetical protein
MLGPCQGREGGQTVRSLPLQRGGQNMRSMPLKRPGVQNITFMALPREGFKPTVSCHSRKGGVKSVKSMPLQQCGAKM